MALNTKQSRFVAQVQKRAGDFVELVNDINILAQQWDENFKTGEANEIDNADLTGTGITTSNLEKILTSNTELQKWWTNQTVTAKQNGEWMRNLMNQY